MPAPWLSADDIAAYSWIPEKATSVHKVGRSWKFQASEIDNWARRGGAPTSTQDEDAG